MARFEEWDGAGRRFDAVTAFTAFHWLDASAKYERAARLLRDDGSLAVVTTSHVFLDDMDAALGELQQEYAAIGWGDGSFRPPRPGELPGFREEIESSGYFRDVSVRRYLMRVRYSSEEFVSVLGTYSDHLALDPETRERLFSGLRRRIDRLGGTFAKDYEFTLHVARRR